MNRADAERAKGAAMGMMAGAAMGAMGAYLMQQHPKEVKRAVKKAAHAAEQAIEEIDRTLTAH